MKLDDPRVRRDITSHFELGLIMSRLGLTPPMKILDAAIPDDDGSYVANTGGTTYPEKDKHCVYVDLESVRGIVSDYQTTPSLRSERLIREQLPEGIPFIFENVVRSTVAHELSHLAEGVGGLAYNIETFLHGYANNSSEKHARLCGRELYNLIQVHGLS